MSVVRNIWNIKDLRTRILFTLGLIFICRFVAMVPTPGVNGAALGSALENASRNGGGLMGMFDLFSGGALGNFAVGTLNIWPYISAQIIIQLMTAIIPSLERMAREVYLMKRPNEDVYVFKNVDPEQIQSRKHVAQAPVAPAPAASDSAQMAAPADSLGAPAPAADTAAQ